MILKRLVSILLIGFIITNVFAGVGVKKYPKANIHVISIGINKYSGGLHPLNLCVADSDSLIAKIVRDNKNNSIDLKDSNGYNIKDYNISNVFIHKLNDENATIGNIRNAFKKVIEKASYNDYFVFYFSGYSMETDNDETLLAPYNSEEFNFDLRKEGNRFRYSNYDKSKLLPLVDIAKLMDQIASKNQLIISEAGNGTSFGQNLISELFESNPYIAEGTERNRIILTTKEMGVEGGLCNGKRMQNGYMINYMLQNGNILDAFYDLNQYEFWLTRSEMMCPFAAKKYIAVFQESDYRNILLKNYSKGNTRGSKSKQVITNKEDNISSIPKTYAFIVATDTYNKSQTSWDDLKNPIKDADVFSEVLETKYNVRVNKVYNKEKQDILKEFIEFKKQINENDKLIFFVAGHGYFSEDFSDGYLVLKDSYGLDDDITLDSYLSMAKLNRILDGVKSKQVFSIFDVCYGASFELNNADLPIENYSQTKMDNGLQAFISEKDESTSRIVLASGQYEVPDYWIDSQEHSPFADKLIKALKSEQEFISPGKIFSYVQGNAPTPILKKFGTHDPRGDFLMKVFRGTR